MKLKKKTKLLQKTEEGKNGFPDPIPTYCFICSKQFWIRWVNTKQRYSEKNNLYYYTEKESDKNLKICNSCLRSLYFDKETYWKTIQNLKKRAVLARYVNLNLV
ncbi:MAG: hypothetical protein I3273_06760 [Candidatus Moeniiplasma glomeromycotorum]|nr:hypothetical protein [Candidatus Moeniiplasma glomeromycotorum]MCE8169786.1 hypothetical protein [Candidatus Moeniiplasma glomeromycotorum]